MIKNEPYICPKCGHEGQSINKVVGSGSDSNYDECELLMMTLECPKCREVWTEVFVINYDGYNHKLKQYRADGELLADWEGCYEKELPIPKSLNK